MKVIRNFLVLYFLLSIGQGAFAEEAYQVTAKAWSALGRKDWNAAVAHADRALKTWGSQARQTNSRLKGYASAKDAKKHSNLNEVGTCLMLKGDALRQKGDVKGANAAYELLLSDFQYAQVWDPKGWFWKPAEAARKNLVKLKTSSISFKLKVAQRHFTNEQLKLPGKKGICLTMRKTGEPGSAQQNMSKLKKVNPYWSYSWGWDQVPSQPAKVEFVPMAWCAWSVDGLRKGLHKGVTPHVQSGKVKRFLGFNEPDKPEQANMSYRNALKYWPQLEALKVPLCSPACANPEGINDNSVQGVRGTWMRDFMTEADRLGYRVDYTGVHWYGGTHVAHFKEKMRRIYEKYGKRPILITEFAPADWAARNLLQNRHKSHMVLAFMKEVLPWLERQDWVAGYAWFSFGINEAVGHTSALYDKNGDLTACGRYYQSINTQNPDGDQSIGE
ncbi:MAG: glycosyl hydrolase [Opitutales bacterium]